MTPTAVWARIVLPVLAAVALASVSRATERPVTPPSERCTLGLLERGPSWTPERTPRILRESTAWGSLPGH